MLVNAKFFKQEDFLTGNLLRRTSDPLLHDEAGDATDTLLRP